ncbi:MAG: carboxy terminal-processing peptidase [Polaribacter sp.]|nr:carboxy terminal-processing peptidase [Polaribacter sp.]MDG1810950.1 carboxy terminal-processing peptidase [Polaribacter sp.]MDG1994009.1 carboxy terminal-processing peptidase [Polaribacter sp.]
MKRTFKFIIPFVAFFILLSSFTTNPVKNDPKKDKVLISVINYMLTNGHYLPKDLDDDFSEHVFKTFTEGLDPSKRYFTQEDIADFAQYKYLIDNQLKKADLAFYHLVYGRFTEKIKSAKKYYGQILAQPFNFNKRESIDVDYSKASFPANETELINNWRKQLKLNTLSRIQEKQDLEDNKAESDKKFKKSSFKTLEANARKEVFKSMDELYIRIEELENSDWFSTFLNSIITGFDPHSTYMAPNVKERFDVDMSGKIEGIGARLQKKGNYTHVFEVVPGGPAWKKQELEAGDIILKVAQGDQEPLEIVGMRLDDAIKFIKGKKGTEVRLTVKKKLDNSIRVISITRDIVQLGETYVKSSVVNKSGQKFGVINLPQFYIDFSDKNFRDSAKDMEKEIANLKKENVEGLLIDLRNNGGGSLKTAIEIAGLFISDGPIVQVKYRGDKPRVQNDKDSKIQWGGPLVILVNELSASASEIFAAAMQDYNRAVIIGGNQTFGKGTVQNILPINQFYPDYKEDLGFLKMTIQKFYRVNGGSTQKEGVYSDIAMPSRYSYMKVGERDLEGALDWDKVAKANYTPVNTYENFNAVVNESKERIMQNPNFSLINDYAKWLKKRQDDTTYSLNLKQFEKEEKKHKKESEKFKSVFKFDSKLTFESPKSELPLIKKELIDGDKRTAWHQNLAKDIYINEALNVLSQLRMKNMNQTIKN